MKVRFFLRNDRTQRGLSPIYLRVTSEGKKSSWRTHLGVIAENWMQKQQVAIGRDSGYINEQLGAIRYKCEKARQLNTDPETIIKIVSGKEKSSDNLLLSDLFLDYARYKSMRGELSIATSLKYETIRKKIKKIDIVASDISMAYGYKLERYFRQSCRLSNNVASKYVQHVKAVLNHAVRTERIRYNPLDKFSIPLEKKNIQYLTDSELTSIKTKDLLPRLAVIRDVFVFQCYTGCEYSRVASLKLEDIQTGIDGEKWIFTNRQKTGISGNVPLLPEALYRISLYNNHECRASGKVFPVKSNQKMNAYLKEIATLCGIQKKLTTHLSRHTFATTVCLLNGVSMESVSKMMGHSSIKTTQDNYAQIVPERISREMGALRNKFVEKKHHASRAHDV